MKIPAYCYPRKGLRLSAPMLEDSTIFHTDENGQLHEVPKHLAEVLDRPDVLEVTPEFSEEELEAPERLKIAYLDKEGHIQRIGKLSLERSIPSGAGTVREAHCLATAARMTQSSFSRASKVEGGPASDNTERPRT